MKLLAPFENVKGRVMLPCRFHDANGPHCYYHFAFHDCTLIKLEDVSVAIFFWIAIYPKQPHDIPKQLVYRGIVIRRRFVLSVEKRLPPYFVFVRWPEARTRCHRTRHQVHPHPLTAHPLRYPAVVGLANPGV